MYINLNVCIYKPSISWKDGNVFFTLVYEGQNLLKSVGREGNLSCLCQQAALLSTVLFLCT